MLYCGEESKCEVLLDGSQETEIMKTEATEIGDDQELEEENGYADQIHNAIVQYNTNSLELSTFASGGEIDGSLGIPAVCVDGVGRIAYPLCKEQTVTLSGVSSPVAPEREVENRMAWEIDGSLVRINEKWLCESLPKLVTDSCKKLGVDAAKMNVNANLYKIQIYEEGGHFKKLYENEKEPGMFGSLLIQLPAEHEGGQLVVHHEKEHKQFQFNKESADKAYYTAFYTDCEHTLEPVTKGRRLVLNFNLVRGASAPAIRLGPATAAHKTSCEEALVAAARRWCAEKGAVQKLALPLAHVYPHSTATFAGLKGTDLSSLSLLQNAVHPETKAKLFTVHLALVTKCESGMSNAEPRERHWGGHGGYRRFGYGGYDSDDYSTASATGFADDCDVDTSYLTSKWVGASGAEELGSLQVDFGNEIITAVGIDDADEAAEDIFGSEPDLKDDEGYDGTLEYDYHSAVLVFWPVERDFEIKLASSFSQAVKVLQLMDHSSAEFGVKLESLLSFLGAGGAGKTWSLSSVLPLAQSVEQVRTVLGLGHRTLTKADHAAVVVEVSKHGWAALGDVFTAMFRAQSPVVMKELLTLLEPHCFVLVQSGASSDGASAAEVAVPPDALHQLQSLLVTALLQSIAAHYTRAYEYAPAPAVNADGSAKPVVAEHDWVELSRFVIEHCELQDQEAVAAHAGKLLSLHSLNHLLEQLLPTVGGVFDGPFQAKLRECAVQRCVASPQQAADVYAVLTWAVRGGHSDLVTQLPPALKRLGADPASFKGLFALPVVHEVMQSDSVLSRELETLVHARIAAVQPKATPPPFSWRMPATTFATSDARVGPFLASDQQTVTLTGTFTGIPQARKFASMYFSYPWRGVSAEAFGSGRNAGVRLTKNKLAYEAVVQGCAEFEAEIRGLRKLLRVRDRDAVSAAGGAGGEGGGISSAGGSSGSGGAGGEGVGVVGVDSGAPAQKKTKVEPHIYVIA